MSEIKVLEMYKVTVTEYESGWGQRNCPELTKFFTTKEEADKYADKWSTGGYDCYFQSNVEKV